ESFGLWSPQAIEEKETVFSFQYLKKDTFNPSSQLELGPTQWAVRLWILGATPS
ncbi:hypothetical protein SK128_016899, partial [Halocaridina rubra]